MELYEFMYSSSECNIWQFYRRSPSAADQILINTVAEDMAIERDQATEVVGGNDVCYLLEI